MCGIAGFLATEHHPLRQNPRDALLAMGHALRIRGPDGHGEWWDAEAGIGFSHRRLAIIDLSETGAQPMASHCGRWVITFNGEIYNYKDLRARLEQSGNNFAWRGSSDTEVFLAAIAAWGLRKTLEACNGMFALALWDREERVLTLARDRFGEKPLYFGQVGGALLFGSEIKALRAVPGWNSDDVDQQALGLYLKYGYVPAPFSIFPAVRKLKQAEFVQIRLAPGGGFAEEHHTFWSPRDAAVGAAHARADMNETQTVEELDALLKTAVKLRMVSDVPLGAFLSGGVDSAMIVALMQSVSNRPVRSFTIGFSESAYDEAPFARAVANHLGTDHTELVVTPHEAEAAIPLLPQIWDEPFADSSQIPTYLVSKLARPDVTVALTGDGGDEIFGGYRRYFSGQSLAPVFKMAPHFARQAASRTLLSGLRGEGVMGGMLGGQTSSVTSGRLRRLALMVGGARPIDGYLRLVTACGSPEDLLPALRGHKLHDPLACARLLPDDFDFVEQMMYLDTITYLPDDILTKLDRGAMASSLEGRSPFLDPDVFDFAWSLPLRSKVSRGSGKRILKKLLARYVPTSLVDRPKSGFSIPVGDWLRTDLRDWAESLVGESALASEPYLDAKAVGEIWQRHRSGASDEIGMLWPILMYRAWRQTLN